MSAQKKGKVEQDSDNGQAVEIEVRDGSEDQAQDKAVKKPADEETVTIPVSEILAMQAEIEELRDNYLRTAADFDNYRKRQEREREDLICYANERLIADLLPILDNLERALEAKLDQASLDSILSGVRMVNEQLHGVLKSCGLEPIPAVGGAFDPNLHEAVGVLPSGAHDEGTVVSELQKGYALKGKVLRPSMVHVAGAEEKGEKSR